MKAILDTNLLISGRIAPTGYQPLVSSLSWAKLRYGICKATDPIQRAHRETRLNRLQQLLGDGPRFELDVDRPSA